jgi:hypothetical protein
MTPKQIEQIAVTLYELDRQRGLRYQRWAVGAETKRERYRARARDILTREKFSQAKGRLERQYWLTGRMIAEGCDLTCLPEPLPSQARH